MHKFQNLINQYINPPQLVRSTNKPIQNNLQKRNMHSSSQGSDGHNRHSFVRHWPDEKRRNIGVIAQHKTVTKRSE